MNFILNNEQLMNVENMPIPISIGIVQDSKLNFILVSKGYCDFFSQTKAEALSLLNTELCYFTHKDDRIKLIEFFNEVVSLKNSSYDISYRSRTNDNDSYFLLHLVITVKTIEDKKYLYFLYSKVTSNLENSISHHKKIESQQLSIAEDSLNAIAIIAKKDFKILYLNKAAKLLFSHDSSVGDTIPCYQFFRNRDNPCEYCPIKLDNSEGDLFEIECEYFNMQIQVHLVETVWDGQEAYIEYIRDITSEKRNERLFNLYKSLISYKHNSNIDVGALYGFDIETGIISFYFLDENVTCNEGKSFDEVIKYFYPSIVGEEDKEKFLQFYNLEKIRRNASLLKTETVEYHQKLKGEIVTIRASYSFIEDPITKHTLAIVKVYDITQRLEMEKMLKAIVTEQNEFVMRQDPLTKTCVVLARSNNFLNFPKGYSRYSFEEYDNYLQQNFKIKTYYGNPKLISCEEIEKLIKTGNYSTTYVIEKDNQKYFKRVFSFRSSDNSLYTVVYDVTDLALQEKNRNKKLEKINKKLSHAKIEASIANKAKSEFLSRMSHDMRTPLGAILSLSDFGLEENDTTKFREYFNQIKENADYLLSLVNDLLDFQKIESNTIDIDNKIVEFGSTAKSIERIVKLRANEKNIKLICSAKREIDKRLLIFDEKRFKQILVNLLNNAIKYTPQGGTVKWSLIVKNDINGQPTAYHTISDNGVGMSKEFQKNMFQPFSKEHNILSEAEGGTGLGLVITKNIVEAMNGKIRCESELKKGTTFYIELPLGIPTEEQLVEYRKHKNTVNYEVKFNKKRILVCEDVKINQIIISKLLEEKNAIVTIANNGLEGVSLAKENIFDAILMDIRMPVLDGTKATERIREFNKTVPIIALSANAFSKDVERSIYVGMNAHLAKPIEKELLYKTLAKFF